MRRMLEAKKQEVQGDLSRSMDYAQMAEKTAEERKRIREKKQRQARQQAIQVRAEPHGKKDVALETIWIPLWATIESLGRYFSDIRLHLLYANAWCLCVTVNFCVNGDTGANKKGHAKPLMVLHCSSSGSTLSISHLSHEFNNFNYRNCTRREKRSGCRTNRKLKRKYVIYRHREKSVKLQQTSPM